jgi:hypothetical protein
LRRRVEVLANRVIAEAQEKKGTNQDASNANAMEEEDGEGQTKSKSKVRIAFIDC